MSAQQANTSSYRYEPYKNYRFRVKWEGSYVAAFTKVSGLSHETHIIDHRSGADPNVRRVVPGQSEYIPLSLERGISYDIAFQQWANQVWARSNAGNTLGNSNSQPALPDIRKDIVIEVYNEAGQKVIAYKVYRCWPSGFNAAPELDGTGNAVVIQSMILQNEGWERDTSIPETGGSSN